MKIMRKRKFSIIPVVVLIFIMIGCGEDDLPAPLNPAATAQETSNTAQNGTWRVTYFFDTDTDETSNFTGYSFTFNGDGSVAAVNGSTTVTGTWTVTGGSSSSSDDDHFVVFFASPPDFADLSDDWSIVSVSTTKIELIDVSGGNGGTDYLTFEKN